MEGYAADLLPLPKMALRDRCQCTDFASAFRSGNEADFSARL